MSFLLIAQSLTSWPSQHSRRSERQNIIDRMHTWQLYSVTISEDILTKYGFNRRKIVLLTSITKRIFCLEIGDKVNRITHARIDPHNRQKLAFLMKRHTLVSLPTPLLHSVCMRQRGRGNSLNGTVPTSPPGEPQSGGIPRTWVYDVVSTALKIAPA